MNDDAVQNAVTADILRRGSQRLAAAIMADDQRLGKYRDTMATLVASMLRTFGCEEQVEVQPHEQGQAGRRFSHPQLGSEHSVFVPDTGALTDANMGDLKAFLTAMESRETPLSIPVNPPVNWSAAEFVRKDAKAGSGWSLDRSEGTRGDPRGFDDITAMAGLHLDTEI